MRSWIVEYRPKCGCTALKEPVDCGQGFKVYAAGLYQMQEIQTIEEVTALYENALRNFVTSTEREYFAREALMHIAVNPDFDREARKYALDTLEKIWRKVNE